ncbi:hypothetical protein E8E14_009984 [Neopestalotiopsis sp. 37M]|nr:hypothetical protein E8E14_009984 [Neopestalotiopsis sp. 37M]
MKFTVATLAWLIAHPMIAAGSALPGPAALKKRDCLPALNYTVEIDYVGCYTDPTTPRTLTGASFTLSQNSPENCGFLCGRAGYSYAGVEYTTQCFCGNSIGNEQADESSCSTPCPGDTSATCGQAYFVNVWEVTNPVDGGVSTYFPDCTRDPLCSNAVCDTSLSPQERAAALVADLTIDEKLTNLVEEAPGVPRLGIMPYGWWSEGLHGLASSPGVFFNDAGNNYSYATSFPQPILTGAAFDDELVRAIGEVISTETRAYDNVGRVGLDLYTPNINPFRDPRWGRGQETPSEDPFHVQSYVAALLSALEDSSSGEKKVIATCKHYAGYDFEGTSSVSRHSFDAVITLQDLSEYYLPPFKTCAADQQVGAIMCSYNAVNGVPACADSYLLEDILRQHWGWEKPEHYVSTDCGAIDDISGGHSYASDLGHALALALQAGTDVDCSFGDDAAYQQAWNQSLITEDEVDKALTRLYTALVSVGFFDPASTQPLRALDWSAVNTPDAQTLAYQAAAEGAVLLKNDGTLPLALDQVGSVALIGPWAQATTQMQGNYAGPAPYLISPADAATTLGLDYTYVLGSGISSSDSSAEEAIQAASSADTIIYMGGIDNTIEAESLDRTDIAWPASQLDLIRSLAALGKPLVVIQFGGGQVDDTELLANESINALLWGGYPGQSGGSAILDILFGNVAPAGRLPITQYPASYTSQVPPTDMDLRPSTGNANLGRTHMWYDGEVVPFGFGLHYTDFAVEVAGEPTWLNGFSAEQNIDDISSQVNTTDWLSTLNLPVLEVPISVENTGSVTSDYVVLLFANSTAGPTPRPSKILAAYGRVKGVEAGATATTSLEVTLDRLVRVDEQGNRVLYPGSFELFVDIDAKAGYEFTWTGSDLTIETFPQPSAATEKRSRFVV